MFLALLPTALTSTALSSINFMTALAAGVLMFSKDASAALPLSFSDLNNVDKRGFPGDCDHDNANVGCTPTPIIKDQLTSIIENIRRTTGIDTTTSSFAMDTTSPFKIISTSAKEIDPTTTATTTIVQIAPSSSSSAQISVEPSSSSSSAQISSSTLQATITTTSTPGQTSTSVTFENSPASSSTNLPTSISISEDGTSSFITIVDKASSAIVEIATTTAPGTTSTSTPGITSTSTITTRDMTTSAVTSTAVLETSQGATTFTSYNEKGELTSSQTIQNEATSTVTGTPTSPGTSPAPANEVAQVNQPWVIPLAVALGSGTLACAIAFACIKSGKCKEGRTAGGRRDSVGSQGESGIAV